MTRMSLLSNEMWARVEPLLPPVKGAIGARDHRHRRAVRTPHRDPHPLPRNQPHPALRDQDPALNPQSLRLHVHQGVRDQESTALKARQRDALIALNELRRDYEILFRDVVAEGVADGSLRNIDVVLATRVLLSSLNAVDVWYRKADV
jgi:hypothetical protein